MFLLPSIVVLLLFSCCWNTLIYNILLMFMKFFCFKQKPKPGDEDYIPSNTPATQVEVRIPSNRTTFLSLKIHIYYVYSLFQVVEKEVAQPSQSQLILTSVKLAVVRLISSLY